MARVKYTKDYCLVEIKPLEAFIAHYNKLLYLSDVSYDKTAKPPTEYAKNALRIKGIGKGLIKELTEEG